MKPYKIVSRDIDDGCLHDTGIWHPINRSCRGAEQMMDITHMREDDPLHEEFWHNDDCDTAVLDNGWTVSMSREDVASKLRRKKKS